MRCRISIRPMTAMDSPGRHHASRVQYDLTLRYAIPSRSFYARSKGWSFYAAKVKTGVDERHDTAAHVRFAPNTGHASGQPLWQSRVQVTKRDFLFS